jgi:hypothetical protein
VGRNDADFGNVIFSHLLNYGSHKIPDKNLITPDRRDILSAPKGLPSGAEAPLSEREAGAEPDPEACPAYVGGGVRPAAGPAYRLQLSMK